MAGPKPNAVWAHDLVFWGSLFVVFVALRASLRSRAHRGRLALAIAVAGLSEAIYAIVQYAQASERFSLLGGAIVYPQPAGTLRHPNALGPFLVVCLLLVVAAAAEHRPWRPAALGSRPPCSAPASS